MIEVFNVAQIEGDKPSVKAAKPRRVNRTALTSRDRWLIQTLGNISFRCTNPKDKRYKDYGGRGIKNFLTLEDLQFLYERDRPDLMSRPSIDRKENDEHYERDNCQFLEMKDNRAKAKRRKYPCDVCGVIALPKFRDGKKLCNDCAKLARFDSAKYVEYVNFVIRECRDRGFTVGPVFIDKNKDAKVSTHCLTINGAVVSVHYAAQVSTTGPYSGEYWRFHPSHTADFSVLVAKLNKARRAWIFVGKANTNIVYIPRIQVKNPKGPRPLRDWLSLEGAWYLLAAPSNQELDQQAAQLASEIDPYRPILHAKSATEAL